MSNRTATVAITYILLWLITIVCMCWGIVTITATITLYATLLLAMLGVLAWLKRLGLFTQRYADIKLLCASVIITLFTADIALRYVVKPAAYLDYKERNGRLFYASNTLMQKFRFINKDLVPRYWIDAIHTFEPNSTRQITKSEFSYTHVYNSLGLRSSEIPVAKKSNEKRILTLGDSFTEGNGAPADSTWPMLLGKQLNAAATDTTYTVINGGANGSDPYFEQYLLQHRMLAYRPDVVMVAINPTDLDDIIERGGYERFNADNTYTIKDSPWWEPLYGASMLVRIVARNVFNYTYHFKPAGEEAKLKAKAVSQLLAPLKAIIATGNVYHFKVVFIFHPLLKNIKQNDFPFKHTIEQLQADSNITVIDLHSELNNYFNKNNLRPENYYWAGDQHHNAAGYKVWSELVFDKIKKQ